MGKGLNLHALLDRSRANGPGERMVIWFQGCTLACPGCCNPETHPFEPRIETDVEALLDRISATAERIDGITLSGGEPLAQAAGLLALVDGIRRRTQLSTLLFSGYRIEEIQRQPLGPAILGRCDLLIAGRYQQGRQCGQGLRGSSNQQIHLLSDRHTLAEVEGTPELELQIGPDGAVLLTGVAAPMIPPEG